MGTLPVSGALHHGCHYIPPQYTAKRALCARRAAVLERMPVIDKSSPGHTNGESAGGTIKELEPTKLTHEIVFPQEPSNQVSDENDCNKLWYFSYLDI